MTSLPRYFQNHRYYHCFNRGVDKRDIFLEDKDYLRFLNSVELCNDPSTIRTTNSAKKTGQKFVEIVNFCLMSNHFHFTLKQVSPNGVSIFLHRLSTSYTKYFNKKNKRTGRLFEYVYKAVEIVSDEQLLHLSRYIHLNPYVAGLIKEPEDYRWSSLKDYLSLESLIDCDKEAILGLFKNISYKRFLRDQKEYAKELNQIKHLLVD